MDNRFGSVVFESRYLEGATTLEAMWSSPIWIVLGVYIYLPTPKALLNPFNVFNHDPVVRGIVATYTHSYRRTFLLASGCQREAQQCRDRVLRNSAVMPPTWADYPLETKRLFLRRDEHATDIGQRFMKRNSTIVSR
jgi:hypothetical protein